MSSGPVEQVTIFLEAAGYTRVEQPQPIGGIPFHFDAMLAHRGSLDLIVAVDLVAQPNNLLIQRQVGALARALDLVRSRRSLTVILAGPRRGVELVQALSGFARVLVVGTPSDQDEVNLQNALAVLLPLQIATQDRGATEPWIRAQARLRDHHPAEAEPLLAAAPQGQAAVEAALAALLAAPLEALDPSAGFVEGEDT